LADVERRYVPDAQLVLEDSTAAGEVMVRRHGGEDDVVQLFLRDAGVRERILRRAETQIARRRSLLDVVARLDPAALADPGIGGVHDLGELLVGAELLARDQARCA